MSHMGVAFMLTAESVQLFNVTINEAVSCVLSGQQSVVMKYIPQSPYLPGLSIV